MEKEQKKLLLVAVSVGVFLLVTITVALILLTSKPQMQADSHYTAAPFIPSGNIQSAEPANVSQPIINNTQETNINIGFDNAEILEEEKDRASIQVHVPPASNAGVPNTEPPAAFAAAPRAETEPVKPAATVASIVQRPAQAEETPRAAVQTQPAPVRPAAQNATAAQPARTTAPAKSINDFWIQTGAFTAKVRADDAKELLESKGFASIIENREIDGKTWYRVRLGPYTSENEANYWLALVQSIDGFRESQVRQTIR